MSTYIEDERNLFSRYDIDHEVEFYNTKNDKVVQVGRRGKYHEDLDGNICSIEDGTFDWCHEAISVRYNKIESEDVKEEDPKVTEEKRLLRKHLRTAQETIIDLYTERMFALDSWKNSKEDEEIHALYSEVKDIDVQINSAMGNLKNV